ncbi:MAG: alpha/beta hydrolase [Ignavibacteriaceae bacterium]
MKMLKICFALLFLCSLNIKAQQIIDLYSGAISNSKESNVKETEHSGMFSGVTKPTLEIYLPEKEKSTGTAVVICPGGGYAVVVYQAEGIRTAKEFAKNGVVAFVLKYRLPNDSTMIDKKIGPLQDAQQAIKVVRENAAKWGIDINKVGIMGFSAGGHLASTEATHYKEAVIENKDNTNLRPDFQILVYPVISMQDSLTHLGSRTNLLGKNPSKKIIDEFSNELHVDENTPPAYITQAADDKVVDVDNSIVYWEALRHHNVSAELHIYPKGNHGFVLRLPTEEWMSTIFKWMKNSKWINK